MKNEQTAAEPRYAFGYFAGYFTDAEWKAFQKKIKAASTAEKALIKRMLVSNC